MLDLFLIAIKKKKECCEICGYSKIASTGLKMAGETYIFIGSLANASSSDSEDESSPWPWKRENDASLLG